MPPVPNNPAPQSPPSSAAAPAAQAAGYVPPAHGTVAPNDSLGNPPAAVAPLAPVVSTPAPVAAPLAQPPAATAPLDPPAVTTPETPAVAPKKIATLLKDFKTEEEHLAYTQQLERQVYGEKTGDPQAAAADPAPATQAQSDIFKQAEQDFWTKGPAVAFKNVMDHTVETLGAQEQKKQAATSYWATFYQEYPDLVGAEELVESKVSRHHDEIKALKLPESRLFLARKTRELVATIRGKEGTTETVVADTSTASPSSIGQPAPAGAPQAPAAPSDFSSEIRSMHQKHLSA